MIFRLELYKDCDFHRKFPQFFHPLEGRRGVKDWTDPPWCDVLRHDNGMACLCKFWGRGEDELVILALFLFLYIFCFCFLTVKVGVISKDGDGGQNWDPPVWWWTRLGKAAVVIWNFSTGKWDGVVSCNSQLSRGDAETINTRKFGLDFLFVLGKSIFASLAQFVSF